MIGRRSRRNGARPAEPPVPAITTYDGALNVLLALGFQPAPCPALCRRKTAHTHMAHGSGTTGLTVFPGSAR